MTQVMLIKDEKIDFDEKEEQKFPIILSIRCSRDGRKFISAANNNNFIEVRENNFQQSSRWIKQMAGLSSVSVSDQTGSV